MVVRLFFYLILISAITAYSTPKGGSEPEHITYNEEQISKLPTETLNEAPGGAALYTKPNSQNGESKEPIKQDKNTNETKEEILAESSQGPVTFPQYEVTENVEDIPDDRTPRGPIVTNYTEKPALNLGNPNKTNKFNAANIKNKKNRISILHIDAEFDDKVKEPNENKVLGILKSIKQYIGSFHRGIVRGFHTFFHKCDHDHEHGGRSERANGRNDDEVHNVDKTEYFVRQKHISLT